MIGAVWKLIIFTSMANRVINTSGNEIMWEERRLRDLRRILGPKKDEVTGVEKTS
jgi:hypothetical protein